MQILLLPAVLDVLHGIYIHGIHVHIAACAVAQNRAQLYCQIDVKVVRHKPFGILVFDVALAFERQIHYIFVVADVRHLLVAHK